MAADVCNHDSFSASRFPFTRQCCRVFIHAARFRGPARMPPDEADNLLMKTLLRTIIIILACQGGLRSYLASPPGCDSVPKPSSGGRSHLFPRNDTPATV